MMTARFIADAIGVFCALSVISYGVVVGKQLPSLSGRGMRRGYAIFILVVASAEAQTIILCDHTASGLGSGTLDAPASLAYIGSWSLAHLLISAFLLSVIHSIAKVVERR